MSSRKVLRTVTAASLALLGVGAGAATAEAGPPGKWSQVTGLGADERQHHAPRSRPQRRRRPTRELEPGRAGYRVTASKKGYAAFSKRVRVK
jgi:hypothetical protein